MEMDEKTFTARVDEALRLIREEMLQASKVHGGFRTMHEGYAVMLEEVDEVWDEVRRGNRIAASSEALQAAAMALRFVIDFGSWSDSEKPRKSYLHVQYE